MRSIASVSTSFYGSRKVGERGQIVIPSRARADLGIHPGDKVLLFAQPTSGALVVCKSDVLSAFTKEIWK